jgi:hypothetical protein
LLKIKKGKTKMSPREQIVTLISQYVNSFSAENKFLGNEDILNNIKARYSLLPVSDKEYSRAQLGIIFRTTLSPEEMDTFKRYKTNFVVNIAVGATVGAIGGALIGNSLPVISSGKFLFKTAVGGTVGGAAIGGGIGGFGGTFFSTRHLFSSEKALTITRKLRPFNRLKTALGIIPVSFEETIKGLSQRTEEKHSANSGLRNRRGRGRVLS